MNIAYHWKRKATPILCIATGISRTASAMSLTAAPRPLGAASISASISADGLSSFVRSIATSIVTRMTTVPIMKHEYIQYGTPLPALPTMTFCRMNRDRFASTAPAPVNMLWVRKPRATCESGSRSDSSAR